MDRRTRKTRETLFEAFIKLLREKEFERITIQEIADRADVNRGTVYLHFQDKFDLLNQCIDVYLHQLNESCRPEDPGEAPAQSLLRTFEYLEASADLYDLLIRSNGIPAFRSRLSVMLKQGVEQQFEQFVQDGRINKEIAVQFVTTAIVGLFEWWIAHDMPYPPAEMVKQLMILLEPHGLPGSFTESEQSASAQSLR